MPEQTAISEQPIFVNGEPHALPQAGTLEALLTQLGMQGRRVAVAVNREVVPRSGYASAQVAGGDQVEILEAVGGG